MRMTLLELSEEIRKVTGYDFYDADVCVDIIDTDEMIGSVAVDNEKADLYVEFEVEDIDCNDLAAHDKNYIVIKEVQSSKKHNIIDTETEAGRTLINYIPELDWYELDIDGEPLQYFETLEEAKGDLID